MTALKAQLKEYMTTNNITDALRLWLTKRKTVLYLAYHLLNDYKYEKWGQLVEDAKAAAGSG